MRIRIALKLRPFSHEPGMRCLIPYTTWEVQAFPALLRFRDLTTDERKDVELDTKGPVSHFALIQDLERGRVELIRRGHPRLLLNEENFPFLKPCALPMIATRISFGVHKAQDWNALRRRAFMPEVFPFLFRLSHLIPREPLPKSNVGTMRLLDSIEDGRFFQAAFQGILSPRLADENHLGIIANEPVKGCPLGLIHAAAERIIALFFHEEEGQWQILPSLPKEFHAGRIVDLVTKKGHRIQLEWSKKTIKKMIIDPVEDETIHLHLKKGIKGFRLRTQLRQKGHKHTFSAPVHLEKGLRLYLDRFFK